MTTKTGMSDHWKLKYLNRLIALTKSAYELISEDKRTERDTKILLDALQAFKLGQLRGVMRPVMDGSTREDILNAFSTSVEDADLTDETAKYLLRRGVRFIGEAFYIIFDARSPTSVESGKAIFRELRDVYGLNRSMDPLTLDWHPPYWNAHLGDALYLPVLKVFGEYDSVAAGDHAFRYRHRGDPAYKGLARRLHLRGIHYLGQYIQEGREPKSARSGSAWMPGQLEDKQKILTATNAPLWAAALLPPGWWKSPESPIIWDEEQKKIEQETTEWQAQKERERQERVAAEPTPSSPEEELEADLLRSVEELELSVRSADGLNQLGVLYVGQLVQYTEDELMKLSGSRQRDRFGLLPIGRKSLKEIKEILASMGLQLGLTLKPEINAKLETLVAGN
jgi:hypothetical protein